MQHRRWNSNNDRILFQICDWIPIQSNCKVDTFILAFLHLVQIFRAPFLLFLLLILIILAPLPGLIYYFTVVFAFNLDIDSYNGCLASSYFPSDFVSSSAFPPISLVPLYQRSLQWDLCVLPPLHFSTPETSS